MVLDFVLISIGSLSISEVMPKDMHPVKRQRYPL